MDRIWFSFRLAELLALLRRLRVAPGNVANGGIRWNRQWVNVSTVCVGEYVGLNEIADALWNLYPLGR
jgi:hypothetical protein